jgi:3' terminal RNA ribose 2'-O-methyltransferase Hen1
MLLIRTDYRPATDLGFLLHKHPGRMHVAEMPFGTARLLFTEASDESCAVAVIVEIDPIGLVRGSGMNGQDQYVNDRPYVASSYLSSTLVEFFSTAMSGRSKERPDLAATAIPLEFQIPAIRCRGGEGFLRSLFEPLGYTVSCEQLGDGNLYSVNLKAEIQIGEALLHLTVLVPVLDDAKHYFVDQTEIDKLFRRGASWLPSHPKSEEITRRYLKHQGRLTREALTRLAELDGFPETEEEPDFIVRQDRPNLHDARLDTVAAEIVASGASRILDLGCGEGKLIQRLMKSPQISEVVGVDISVQVLESAKRRLRLGEVMDKVHEKVRLVHGSLTYRDQALSGYDAATLVEVIEHLDAYRLESLGKVVFGEMAPKTVVVTTPNSEYNVLFPGLAAGKFRHPDHRFEWTRTQFNAWCEELGQRWGYRFRTEPVGPVFEDLGAPTQMAVFSR